MSEDPRRPPGPHTGSSDEPAEPAATPPEEPAAANQDRRRGSRDGRRRNRRNRRPRSDGAVVEAEKALAAGTPPQTLPAGGREKVAEETASPTLRAGGREKSEDSAQGGRDLYRAAWSTGVPNVLAIARRELVAFFVSPIGYVVAAVLVLPVSFLGYLARIGQGLPVTMDSIFGLIALLMVFFTPLYTMRLLAEERRAGTLEVLLTSPVRDWELVTGKWLGGFLFYLATIAFTLVYVVLLSIYTPTHSPASILGLHLELPTLDYGRIFAGYVGVALVGAAWVALGLFASSLTSNQIIAAVLGVGFLLAFQYLFGTLSTFLVTPYSDFFDYLNAGNHAASFSAGRLVTKDALYFLTLTIGTLFLTARVLESRKWR